MWLRAGHPQPGAVYSHSAGIIGVANDGSTGIYMPHSEVRWPNAKGPYTGCVAFAAPPRQRHSCSDLGNMCSLATAVEASCDEQVFGVNC